MPKGGGTMRPDRQSGLRMSIIAVPGSDIGLNYGTMELTRHGSCYTGGMAMTAVIAGILVCLYVYVIREARVAGAEEDLENY
jgi:uncharacterized protein (DUF2062 family)